MLRGYATRPSAPRVAVAAALRAHTSPFGSTIWWPDVSPISKHPSVLVPPAHTNSIEELLAAVKVDIDMELAMDGPMGLATPNLSGAFDAARPEH